MAAKKRATPKSPKPATLEEWRAEARKNRKALEQLTVTVRAFLTQLDTIMQQPASRDRGVAVSRLSNRLEMANDAARYFTLGEDFRAKKKPIDPKDAEAILARWQVPENVRLRG